MKGNSREYYNCQISKDCSRINLTRQYNKADINCTSRYVCKYSIIDEQPETQLTLYYHDKDIALEISM